MRIHATDDQGSFIVAHQFVDTNPDDSVEIIEAASAFGWTGTVAGDNSSLTLAKSGEADMVLQVADWLAFPSEMGVPAGQPHVIRNVDIAPWRQLGG